jgi:hypothetical protein
VKDTSAAERRRIAARKRSSLEKPSTDTRVPPQQPTVDKEVVEKAVSPPAIAVKRPLVVRRAELQDESQDVLETVKLPPEVNTTQKMMRHARKGDADAAAAEFEQAVASGLKPNEVMYSALIRYLIFLLVL